MLGLLRRGHHYHESPVSTPPSGGSCERVHFRPMGCNQTVALPHFVAVTPPDSCVCHLSIRILLKRYTSPFRRSGYFPARRRNYLMERRLISAWELDYVEQVGELPAKLLVGGVQPWRGIRSVWNSVPKERRGSFLLATRSCDPVNSLYGNR